MTVANFTGSVYIVRFVRSGINAVLLVELVLLVPFVELVRVV